MNTIEIEKIYQIIASTLNETIPEEWDKVYMYGEVVEGAREAYFNYYPKGSSESVYSHDIPELFDISESEYDKLWYKLLDNLTELKNAFKNNGQEVWTNLTFILESTGKFKIDFDYTDLSEANPNKRHIIWDYNYLGIKPEDNADRAFLEKYLQDEK